MTIRIGFAQEHRPTTFRSLLCQAIKWMNDNSRLKFIYFFLSVRIINGFLVSQVFVLVPNSLCCCLHTDPNQPNQFFRFCDVFAKIKAFAVDRIEPLLTNLLEIHKIRRPKNKLHLHNQNWLSEKKLWESRSYKSCDSTSPA